MSSTDRPYVFVSYSGRSPAEKLVVRRILARLFDQALEVWIYETRDGAIPPGLDIEEYCLHQISRSDLVVAIVSDSTLASEWTNAEVAYSVENNKRIIVIRIDPLAVRPDQWPEAYSKLRGSKHLRIPGEGSTTLIEIEEAVLEICRQLGIPFRDDEVDVRMPLARRLCEELWSVPITPAIEAGIYRDLRLDAFACARAYECGDRKRAARLANRICSIIEERILDRLDANQRCRVPYYYPRLLEAFVSLRIGTPDEEARCREIADALVCEVLGDYPSDPSSLSIDPEAPFPDENLFALIGAIHMEDGLVGDGYAWFKKAYAVFLDRVKLDPEHDSDLDVNIDIATSLFLCEMLLNLPHDEDIERRFLHFLPLREPYEMDACERRVAGIGCCLRFLRSSGSLEFYRILAIHGLPDWGEQIFALVHRLSNHPNDEIRRNGLVHFVYSFSSFALRPQVMSSEDQGFLLTSMGRALDLLGDDETALVYFDALASLHKNGARTTAYRGSSSQIRFLLEAAQFYYSWNYRKQLAACCEEVLIMLEEGPNLRSETKFYYRGFVSWMRGRSVFAKEEFRRSGFGAAFWYPNVLPDCRGYQRVFRQCRRMFRRS